MIPLRPASRKAIEADWCPPAPSYASYRTSEVLETVVSTRRSTRERPAAISSTARCRSSIRPWRDTAKSTRSCFPPPSRTSWDVRTARSFHQARPATSSAAPAAMQAPIAIHSAVESDTYFLASEGEDDLVVGRVVRRRLLARYRLDGDLDRRRQPEQPADVDVREGHGLRLAA